MHEKVNLRQKLDLFDVHWQPKIVARFNDNNLRVVKVKGEFVRHKHEDTNGFFVVKRPPRTTKKPFVSSCLCRTNSPLTLTTRRLLSVEAANDLRLPVHVEQVELLAQVDLLVHGASRRCADVADTTIMLDVADRFARSILTARLISARGCSP